MQSLHKFCVRSVRRVFAECTGLKPYCVSAKGMCGVTSCMINRSITLERMQRRMMAGEMTVGLVSYSFSKYRIGYRNLATKSDGSKPIFTGV